MMIQLVVKENLKLLILDKNQIESIGENAFLGAVNLQTLSLNFNLIENIEANSPENLSSDSNKIKFIRNGTFGHLQKLINLWLHSNQIEFIEKSFFHELISLETLVLSSNKLKALRNETFINLVSLKQLWWWLWRT